MDPKTYYAYIIASRSRTLYVGFTSDLFTRVMQHRNGTFEGFTSTYHCNRLVWYECFAHPTEAITREKQIKRWSRTKKLALIERETPTRIDLAGDWGKPIQLLTPDFVPKPNAGFSTPPDDKAARLRSK